MILTKETNRVYFIDQNGDIFNELDFNEVLKGEFVLKRSRTPFQFNDSSLIFTLGYRGVKTSFQTDRGMRNYSREKLEAKQILKVSNFRNDSIVTSIVLPNIRSRFMSSHDLQAEGSGLSFENRIIFKSYYSDSIYLINSKDLRVSVVEQVKSKYSNIRIRPVAYNEYSLVNENLTSNGRIEQVLYDETQNIYYCIVNHKRFENDRPWSIIVLDGDLKKVDEILMDGSKYNPSVFLSKNGLLISNYNETKNDSDFYLKNTMELFRYE